MIDFSARQWENIKERASLWWDGNLGHPLIQVRLEGKQPSRKMPKHPYHFFTSFYDFGIPADDVIDVWDYKLCCIEHMGDAFPVVWPNFGPGSIAAYLGAVLENGKETVWFHPETEIELAELELQYYQNNPWLQRTREILEAASNRWQHMVQIAMPDLGGSMDILSTFRPGEKLIYDLFDYPERVETLNWEIHNLWWRYFDEFSSIVQPLNPGYSTWARIFSAKPHYMLQCDFCFMLSPQMFEAIVKPELKATADKLVNAFYHLDGPGQLAHLDSILEIDSIKGIQWIPGAGQPDITNWPQVYRKITDKGRKIHICSTQTEKPFDVIDIIAAQTGRVDNIVYHFDGHISDRNGAEKMLEKFI